MKTRSDGTGSKRLVKVAVCIATYRRPDGLRALLKSFDALRFDQAEPEITLVVVENCPEAPATDTLGDISSLTRWPVLYVTEPERGIVAARNRALATAPPDVDFIAFVDDDETVSPEWLNALLRTIMTSGATAVQGPVRPDYETPPPDWVEQLRIFHLGPFNEGERLNFAATNNSVVNAAFLRRHGLKFDPRFNATGGEDEEFYNRLRGAGGNICASEKAFVSDTVPANRLTVAWVARRKFRMGNTLGRIALLRERGRAKRFAKGVLAIGYGLGLMLVLGLGSRARFFAGFLEVARGCGMIAAFARIRFTEYSQGAVLSDRRPG